MAEKNERKVITGEVRLSYARLFKPKKNDQDKDVWSTVILIPKGDRATMAKLKKAAAKALELGIEKGKLRKGMSLDKAWTTLKDGDDMDEPVEAYEGHWYMNVNSYRAPGVVDRHKERLDDERDVYSGCYARVSLTAYPFDAKSNKGVTFGLENVQKLRDGEPLGGAPSDPDDDFDELEDEEYGEDEDGVI
jgi:(2Fe-2S) ferredoxin